MEDAPCILTRELMNQQFLNEALARQAMVSLLRQIRPRGSREITQSELEKDDERLALCLRVRFIPFIEQFRYKCSLDGLDLPIGIDKSGCVTLSRGQLLDSIRQLTVLEKTKAQLQILKYRKALRLERHLNDPSDVSDHVLLFAINSCRSALDEMIQDRNSLTWIAHRIVDQTGASSDDALCSYCKEMSTIASSRIDSITSRISSKTGTLDWTQLVHVLMELSCQLQALSALTRWHRIWEKYLSPSMRVQPSKIGDLAPLPRSWRATLIPTPEALVP
jgi:hypothetical protein